MIRQKYKLSWPMWQVFQDHENLLGVSLRNPTRSIWLWMFVLLIFPLLAIGWNIAAADQKETSQRSAAQSAVPEPSNESVEQLLNQLGSPRYQERLDGFLKLWQRGPAILPEVHQHAKESSRLVAEAIDTLELLMQLNITPTKDDKLVELIQLAQRSNNNALFELCGMGHWKIAYQVLANNPKLATALRSSFLYYRLNDLVDKAGEQGDPALAWPIVQQLVPQEEALWLSTQQDSQPLTTTEDRQLRALKLLFEGKPTEALAIENLTQKTRLRIALTSGRWDLLLEPELADALFGALRQSPSRRAAQIAVMHLNGQPIGEPIQQLYQDLGWVALEPGPPKKSADEKKSADDSSSESLGGLLGKLAANPTEFSKFINSLILAGRAQDAGQILMQVRDPGAFSYFFGRSDHALAFLTTGLNADISNFDEWLNGKREKIALELRGGDSQGFETMTSLCGALLTLGFEEQGERLLEVLVEVSRDGSRFQASSIQAICWDKIADSLQRSQVRARLIALVAREYGAFNRDARMRVLGNLYPEWSEIAAALLATAPVSEFAQQGMSNWDLLEQLWRLDREAFGPKAAHVLESWLNQAEANLSSEEEFTDIHAHQFIKLAGQLRLPELVYEHAVGKYQRLINWSALADIAMRRGDLESAADYWSRARDPDTTRHDWLLQEITARTLAGQIDRASQLQASLAYRPLSVVRSSGESSYRNIAQHLLEQEQPALAQQYARAGFLLAPLPGVEFYLAGLTMADVYEKQEAWVEAADARRAFELTFLTSAFALPRYSMFLSFAQKEQAQRAVGLLARREVSGAKRSIESAESLHPLGIELVEDCYPALIQLGEIEFAEALFGRFEKRMLEHLKTWPKDATNHNNLAWMYARCNKRLDQALLHAEIATKLAPQSPTLLDTLAEVHFRSGEHQLALEIAERCVRLDPREPHYQQQVNRFLSTPPAKNAGGK